jgi:hypothetical protein
MKKHLFLKKLLTAILLVTILTGALAVCASAETLTAELQYLDRWMNLAIQVVYTDNGTGLPPEISFISPGGVEYKVGVSAENEISAQYFQGGILYLIPNAMPGQWQICYDSAFSGHLQVTCSPYSREIDIESFTITSTSSNYADVEFFVGFDDAVRFNYVVSAVVTDENGNVESSRQLSTGRAYSNQLNSLRVPLYDLASFDHYQLQLEVYYDDYGIETGDTALSDPFSYTDPDAPSALGDFFITLDRSTGTLYLDWSEVATWRADAYIVAVFVGEDKKEPVYYEDLNDNITKTSALVDPNADSITVELYWRDGNALSDVKSVTFNPNLVTMEILAADTTAAAQAQLRYIVPAGMDVSTLIQVNDLEPVYTHLSGEGMLPIDLTEGENVVQVTHWHTDFVCVIDSMEIFSDRRPPILSFFESVDSITTSDYSFRLMGMTEAGAVLTVNGKDAAVNADGTFSLELGPMVAGENTFVIVSADPVGNQIRRTVIITCAPEVTEEPVITPGWADYLPMGIAGVTALLIAVLVIFVFRDKGQALTAALLWKRCALAGWCVTLASGGITLWVLIEKTLTSKVVNSTQFFDYVQQSVQYAYELLKDFEKYSQWLTILLLVTVGLALLSLILTVVALILGRKKGEPKPPKEPKPKKEKPEKPKKEKAEKPRKEEVEKPKKEKAKKEKPVKATPAVEQAPVESVAPAAPEPVIAPAEQPKLRFCSNCGTKITEGGRFCSKCGAPLE